jgi:putative flippase GtrA
MSGLESRRVTAIPAGTNDEGGDDPARGDFDVGLGAAGERRGGALERLIHPFLSRRFLRFCVVGSTGVVVNLGLLFVLRRLSLHVNVAAALAIEGSIISNFALHQAWTFRDQRHAGRAWPRQALRFHLVSLGGAFMQFGVFVAANVVWLLSVMKQSERWAYLAPGLNFVSRWVWRPLIEPPEVGAWIYLSQVLGVGAAVAWNYLVNLYWTWGGGGPSRGQPAAMRNV